MSPIRPLQRTFQVGAQALTELVLPAVCRLCHAPVGLADDFCIPCEMALSLSRPMMRAACPRCGMPRPVAQETGPRCGGPDLATAPSLLKGCFKEGCVTEGCVTEGCVHCRDAEVRFDGVAALWAYQGLVCDAVVAAKYPRHAAIGDALGRRLAAVVLERFVTDLPDLVTFVPPHLTRRVSRGGNGAALLAASVAKGIGRPCRSLLRPARRIAKQAWLDDEERLENVHSAFRIKRSYAFPGRSFPLDRHLLVVDDVLTTGATANELARVLLSHGAGRVTLAVVARAVRSRLPHGDGLLT